MTIRHWRIDGEHSNAYAEWRRLGSPEDPSPAQPDRLRARQGLEPFGPPASQEVGSDGTVRLRFELPLYGISLLELTPGRSAGPE